MIQKRLVPESENLEVKSTYTKNLQDRGTLVKTIVAMANTKGGRIVLKSLDVPLRELDSARLDDQVNKYVSPRVEGITSREPEDGAVEISVPESKRKPHVFESDLQYNDSKGKRKGAFYPGQIWVRHGSKNEPATAEDVQRMVRERAAEFLGDLSVTLRNPKFPLQLTDGEGLPVHVSDAEGAVSVNVDVNRQYPYTTGTLGKAVGKNQNWVAAAVSILGLKGNPAYHQPVYGSKGDKAEAICHRYNEKAADRLREEIAARPDWNAWMELSGRRASGN